MTTRDRVFKTAVAVVMTVHVVAVMSGAMNPSGAAGRGVPVPNTFVMPAPVTMTSEPPEPPAAVSVR